MDLLHVEAPEFIQECGVAVTCREKHKAQGCAAQRQERVCENIL